METKILFAGVMVAAGWLGYYLFGRQFIFNFATAYPLIQKMNETQEGLIAPGAKRYTTISAIMTGFVCVLICFVVIRFCPLYLKISFAAGAIVCAFMLWDKITPDNRNMFDSFCAAYYKFVPDDELRTAMFNKKPSQMKLRLHDMGLSTAFIPAFKNEK